MKSAKYVLVSLVLGGGLLAGQANASWQSTLSSVANEVATATAPTSTTGQASTQSSGQASSLSALTGLLGGGTQALSSGNMNNAAGILGYCVQQKLTSATDASSIQNQMLSKLGLGVPEQKSDPHYVDGIMGILNPPSGQPLDLNAIGNSSLAQEVKTQACDLVLKQGMKFLS